MGRKLFIRYQLHCFAEYLLTITFTKEEKAFLKVLKAFPNKYVPLSSNVMIVETILVLRNANGGSLKEVERTASHGKEDEVENLRIKDLTMCAPIGLSTVQSMSSLPEWFIYYESIMNGFLKPEKWKRIFFYRLYRIWTKNPVTVLQTTSYGLVNPSVIWQHICDINS